MESVPRIEAFGKLPLFVDMMAATHHVMISAITNVCLHSIRRSGEVVALIKTK